MTTKPPICKAGQGSDPIGLYVHIPFCVRKCNYCDFCSQPPKGDMIDRYFDRILHELDGYRRTPRISIDTVFIGGGTPSILPHGYMSRLFEMLRDTFDISDNAEITVEINPGTVTREKAEEYKSLGINRISLGLQSIHENELKILGRIHTFADFEEAFNLLRSLGFANIGVDLMYSIPEQTVESFTETVDRVIAMGPEHLSVYSLILEEGTPFGDAPDALSLPTEDEECNMYDIARLRLAAAGYTHYEISNYARAGYECKHNLKYWKCREYIGIGAAAHSFFEGARYGNTRDLLEIVRDPEYTDDGDREGEFVMMHLRLRSGLPLCEFEARFGYSFLDAHRSAVDFFLRQGVMVHENDHLALTERGFYLSNTIMVELM